MAELTAHGLSVDLPPGWEGAIVRRPAVTGETSQPTLHLATFPLPLQVGDFGAGAVELMDADDIFAVLFEYGPESAGTALFEAQGLPRLAPSDFSPHVLQQPLPGQGGVQRFFSVSGRPFCLYVVLGSHALRDRLTPAVNGVLATVAVSA